MLSTVQTPQTDLQVLGAVVLLVVVDVVHILVRP